MRGLFGALNRDLLQPNRKEKMELNSSDEYATRFERYCKLCDATGCATIMTGDGFKDVLCPNCYEKDICPRCGTKSLDLDSNDEIYCKNCNWGHHSELDDMDYGQHPRAIHKN